jgi:hypothetical protein
MKLTQEHEDDLKDIESGVIDIWRTHPEMTDYTVMRAYEAATAYYNALAREQMPKSVKLTGLDATVFEAVKESCERRLGRTVEKPITLEDLVACLRRLRKSVDFWTKEGGRQGYLEFVEKFLP